MSRCLGIDLSTKSVDLAFLDESSDAARWHSIPLKRGFAGVRALRHAYAWASELEDVYLVGIEDPFSAGRAAAKQLGRVTGAVLCSLPQSLDDDAVWLLRTDEWRMACGLKGHGSKADVASWAHERFGGQVELWAQDALDALGVAFAAREINAKAVAA